MEATSRPKLPTWALALIVPVLAVIVAIVTLNVTSDDAGSAASGSTAKNGTEVVIKNFAFSPTPLHVTAGAAVTVANDDSTAHTLTADDGSFDTGVLDGGVQMTITIDKPGHVRVPLRHPQLHDRRDRGVMNRTRLLLLIGAAGGARERLGALLPLLPRRLPRDRSESLLGITVSRSFVLNAIAGVVIAEALVLATRFERLVVPVAAAGVLFAVGTLVAFFCRGTTRCSASTRPRSTTEAVVALDRRGRRARRAGARSSCRRRLAWRHRAAAVS